MLNTLRSYFAGEAFKEAMRRAGRTFLYAFLGVLVPGVLGFLHAVSEWATAEGQAPFPAATSLWFLALAAVTAGFIAVVNLVGIVVEDATGKAPLRGAR